MQFLRACVCVCVCVGGGGEGGGQVGMVMAHLVGVTRVSI